MGNESVDLPLWAVGGAGAMFLAFDQARVVRLGNKHDALSVSDSRHHSSMNAAMMVSGDWDDRRVEKPVRCAVAWLHA